MQGQELRVGLVHDQIEEDGKEVAEDGSVVCLKVRHVHGDQVQEHGERQVSKSICTII